MDTMQKATAQQIDAINSRLVKGQGSIGYRNIGKNSDGSRRESPYLWYSFYRNGKQVQVNAKTNNPEEAYKQLLDARGATDRGISVLPSEAARLTYTHLRDKYLESRGIVSKEDEPCQFKNLDPYFTGMKATTISHDTIDKYIRKRRKQEAADPTIRRELVVLRAMFNEAKNRKMISSDQVPYFNMPDDSKGAAQYIDPATFNKIREQLPNGEPRQAAKGGPKSTANLQPFFTFLYGTSCRLGVAESIPWAWVSKDFTAITIPTGVTKNREALAISLKGAFLAPVREWMSKQFRKADKAVFDTTNYRPEWAKACAAAGVGTMTGRKRTGVRIHDCRASAAINLLDAGVPENIVMQIGGWKNRKMLDRYAKLTPGRAHAAMEAAGNYVQKLADQASAQ
jgi:site-specific recombinase XerD